MYLNLLYYLWVKYYVIEVFIFECNLSIKLKTNLSELRLCEKFSLFLGEELSLEIRPSTLNTHGISFLHLHRALNKVT